MSRADALVERWNGVVGDLELLMLDYSWPSIGVLDLITFPLRKKTKLGPTDLELLQDVSAYIAEYTLRVWKRIEVEGQLNGDELSCPGQSFAVDIAASLRQILVDFPTPFPVIGRLTREVSLYQSVLTPLVMGILTVRSPFGNFLDRESEIVPDVVRVLGQQCVQFYEKHFPTEVIGQIGELYLDELLYPPFLVKEELPLERAMRALLKGRSELKIDRLQKFGGNLARFPDESLSLLGLAISGAYLEQTPTIVAVSEARGSFVGTLRETAVIARGELTGEKDWLSEKTARPEDERAFKVEKALGLLPWVFFDSSVLRERRRESRINELLAALTGFDFQSAVEIAERLISDSPQLYEIRLQRAYLDLLSGRIDEVVAAGPRLISEPGLETDRRVYMLWGAALAVKGDRAGAKLRMGEAYRLVSAANEDYGAIANGYAMALAANDQYDEALEIVETALQRAYSPMTGLKNKTFILRQLGRHEDAHATILEAVRHNPCDIPAFIAAFAWAL